MMTWHLVAGVSTSDIFKTLGSTVARRKPPTCRAPLAAPVLLAKVVESIMTRDVSMATAPAVPPLLSVKLLCKIWTVEFLMMMLPGKLLSSRFTNATSTRSAASTIALLFGAASVTVTPLNLLANLRNSSLEVRQRQVMHIERTLTDPDKAL